LLGCFGTLVGFYLAVGYAFIAVSFLNCDSLWKFGVGYRLIVALVLLAVGARRCIALWLLFWLVVAWVAGQVGGRSMKCDWIPLP
jgi:hypothetical protein